MRKATIIQGDALTVLRTLSAESVHCVVTSPPYWALRDYGTGTWEGGDPDCAHTGRQKPRQNTTGAGEGHGEPVLTECRCGARRVDQQIGLEPTPELYVARIVEVFEEVRRVLRSDGTLWLNMGDCYASNAGSSARGVHCGKNTAAASVLQPNRRAGSESGKLKPKDLVGMPWRVAFALQAAGWWLRSACIWAKVNPMPESVRDRPTKSHEEVFLFAKSETYFYDAEAVREPGTWPGQARSEEEPIESRMPSAPPQRGLRKVGRLDGAHGRGHDGHGKRMLDKWSNPADRNLRTVWRFITHPFPDAHFATFPPELAERCIRAGTSERGCCSACGAPWVREVSREFVPQEDISLERGRRDAAGSKSLDASDRRAAYPRGKTATTTVGWLPGCRCGPWGAILGLLELGYVVTACGGELAIDPERFEDGPWGEPGLSDVRLAPCVVLDPFGGAGTAPMVALRLNRNAVSIELKGDYVDMQERRIREDAPLLNEVIRA